MKNNAILNDKKIDAVGASEEIVVEEKKPQSIRINKKHDGA